MHKKTTGVSKEFTNLIPDTVTIVDEFPTVTSLGQTEVMVGAAIISNVIPPTQSVPLLILTANETPVEGVVYCGVTQVIEVEPTSLAIRISAPPKRHSTADENVNPDPVMTMEVEIPTRTRVWDNACIVGGADSKSSSGADVQLTPESILI